ncbi:hypothetical protein MNSC_08000 [Minisyncoccus archaeophilus]
MKINKKGHIIFVVMGPSHNSHQLKMRVLFLYTEKDPCLKHESFSLGYELLKSVTILYSLLLIL